jgi:inositol 1,4,5-triphosphate receptor type 1/inositol 1,4,5-triphosphate receptor type 3
MEKSGTTFDKHTRRHHLWNYLYYLYCLKLKSPTDFTGLEFEIDNKVKGEDVEWFPAMGEEDTEGEVEGKLTELTTDIDEIIKVVSETVEKAKLTAE